MPGPRNAPFLFLLSVLACRIDATRVADHTLYAANGARIDEGDSVSFAVVGNTRTAIPGLDRRAGRHTHEGVPESIIQSIGRSIGPSGPRFIVLAGDLVTQGRVAAWTAWDQAWAPVLDGHTLPTGEAANQALQRIPGVPLMGDHESIFDRRYRGAEAAFPGVGAAIGFNRVGSWQAFDIETGDRTWRLLFLDSDKARLGSRWREQLAWIPRALEGEIDGLLVFMHEPLYDLGGGLISMNKGGAPDELLTVVEDSSSLTSLIGVFSAGHHTSQALMPDGPFGALHIGAGGGGAPAEDLRRWGPAEGTARRDDIVLEPLFDLALQQALDDWNRARPLPELVIDEARAANSFEGFRATYDAQHFPIYGWWQVQLDAEGSTLVFWHRQSGGEFKAIYMARYTDEDGWKSSKL